MYFPILRAKRNELLALREISNKLAVSGKIIPIIEPVQATKSGLRDLYKCLKVLSDQNIEVILISNPKCKGSLDSDQKAMKNILTYVEKNFTNVSIGHWIGNTTSKLELDSFIKDCNQKFYFLHISEYESYKELGKILSTNSNFKGHILHFNTLKNDYKYHMGYSKITLKDNFNKLKSNKLYIACTDEFFSNDYMTYKVEDYSGFSDFSVIGGGALIKGFTPNTIALHFVYEFKENNEIRIKHFLSETYDENPDVGMMINQALKKLKEFIKMDSKILSFSTASVKLLKILDDGAKTSPGNIKKLTIMHHLELMIEILKDQNDKAF